MRNKPNLALAGFAAAMFLIMLLFAFMWESAEKRASQPPVADTVRLEHTDTCWLPSPPDTVTKTEYKTVLVPAGDVEIDTDVDSARVTLPFEQHQAHLEDVADVWVSGYQVKIDSAVVYKHHTTEIINKPYSVEVYKTPRLTLDIGAAAFYCENRINPCLVGEIRWNEPRTTFSAFGAVTHEGKWGVGVGVTYRLNIIK